MGNYTWNGRSLTHTLVRFSHTCVVGNESISVRYEPVDGIVLGAGFVPDGRASAPRRREHADASGPASVTSRNEKREAKARS